VITQGLNVRGGPGPQYEVIGWLAAGDEVTVLGRAFGWLLITFTTPKGGTLQGWIFDDPSFVKVNEQVTALPTLLPTEIPSTPTHTPTATPTP
jgi:uncharacterized protein YgiM (DUF1202 family)